jgi:O-acetyl-ADP-ribose deacetylase (regulator of RNase III)/uncharacterized protein YwgA
MIRVLVGNILDSPAQTLVNTVNCVGVMGAGIALEFKKRFPEYYRDYRERCEAGKVKLGYPYLYKRLGSPWIVSFPTKDHWKSMTKLSDIIRGLKWLKRHYRAWGIESLAVPPLGTGHGQLEWRVVGPTLYRHLGELNVPVELYAPYGIPNTELSPEFLEAQPTYEELARAVPNPKWIKPAWVAVVEILRRISEQPYRKPVGRTVFQKIAYLATEEGLPTGLLFGKGSFGPFSGELKVAMTRLLNNGIIGEKRGGPMYEVTVGPTFEDASRAYQRDLVQWNSTIDRIVDLFMRTKMDTNTAEIVTAVIFAARNLKEAQGGRLTEKQLVDSVMNWKARRRPPLAREQIAYMVRTLAALRWIKVEPSSELSDFDSELVPA